MPYVVVRATAEVHTSLLGAGGVASAQQAVHKLVRDLVQVRILLLRFTPTFAQVTADGSFRQACQAKTRQCMWDAAAAPAVVSMQ
jgi:hypothetical protein